MLGWAILLLVPAGASAVQLRYDKEYPAIGYSTATPTDPVTRLKQKIESDVLDLDFDAEHGYLPSLLRELRIPVDSQVLVFSKTSFQRGLISPETPRAIYFDDDVYVAWVKDGPALEISAFDADLGAIFYTLGQKPDGSPRIERQTSLCLRCHDSYSLTGGGVPRHLMGSMLPDRNGDPVYHEGWYVTDDRSPLEVRWGGWYVTGTHGRQRHMGNLIAGNPAEVAHMDFSAGANVTDLGKLIETGPYLGKHSDIVALMVLEHQVRVSNLLTRVSWDTRSALDSGSSSFRVESVAEPLVRALLFVDEATLEDPITGTSGFTEEFERRGPRDASGRSLRQLDLTRRLFRYPLSYLIYSDAFDALPEPVRDHVYRRLLEVLSGKDDSKEFSHLSEADREAILEILGATRTDFAAFMTRTGPGL